MRNCTDNSQKLGTQCGLHCVWELTQESGVTRLVARWVETRGEAFQRHENEAVCAGKEEGEPWPGTCLQAA